jgi:hypothetical protein
MQKKIIIGIFIVAIFLTFGCLSGFQHATPELCEKISSTQTKEQCYWESATINKDSSLCEKITSQENKDLCYKDIATGNTHWSNTVD